MSFQWIIDNAEDISIERKPVVGQTISRSGVVRSVSRGGAAWRFTVTPASGMPWITSRPYIANLEYQNKITASDIRIGANNSWIVKYQGSVTDSQTFTASWIKGNSFLTLISTPPNPSNGYKFRSGDIIKLGNFGKVYAVTGDVQSNSNTVGLHRPIVDETNTSSNIIVGEAVNWNVICTQMPSYTISPGKIITWNGQFIFYEVLA